MNQPRVCQRSTKLKPSIHHAILGKERLYIIAYLGQIHIFYQKGQLGLGIWTYKRSKPPISETQKYVFKSIFLL